MEFGKQNTRAYEPGKKTPDVIKFITEASGRREPQACPQSEHWAAYDGHDGPYEVRYLDRIRLTVRWRRLDGWVWTVMGRDTKRAGYASEREVGRYLAERHARALIDGEAAAAREWARRAGIVDIDQTDSIEEEP